MERAPATFGLLIWLSLVVLWLTWTPVGDGPSEVLLRPYVSSWPVVVGNLLLFAPFGFVLAAGLAGWRAEGDVGRSTGGLVLRVAAAAAALSLVVELGQLFVPGRHVSPYDLAMNTAGAAAAAWAAVRLLAAGWRPRALVGAGAGAVFAGVVLFVSVTGFAASRMLELAQWRDAGYQVLAGDEVGGGRAYVGWVDFARVCGGPPLDDRCVKPGAGARERERLTRRALDRQHVRLFAVVRPDHPQSHHARIVTFSRDSGHRNATLSQEGRALVLRLRTPRGGPNGVGLEFRLPDALPDGVTTHVYASYERGRVELAAKRHGSGVRGVFPLGYFTGWWLVRRLPEPWVEPGALLRAALIAAAAFSVPLGLAAVLSGLGGPLVRVLAGGALPPVLLVLLAGPMEISVPGRDLALAAGFGLVGVILGFVGPRSDGGSWKDADEADYIESDPERELPDDAHPEPSAHP